MPITFGQFIYAQSKACDTTLTQALALLVEQEVITLAELTQLLEELAVISAEVQSVRESLLLPNPAPDESPILLKIAEFSPSDYKALTEMPFTQAYTYLMYRSISIEKKQVEES